ncbi:hypothetical protein LEP1GSC034_3869 [Leptospira interrogans str. 2003000735]|uniref:Uncharacterized protein n=2 Tax=Leptospira interrogans TaxID=173 RepID=A0A829D8D1_LEPIR|nr:hypothetical protein [Leptospira interrogans]EMY05380.1 hypothetical protein LEP1GSC029_3403 [Leptospira interrogans str. 2002000626]EMY24148.1 hypothetical protein LEP1GSC115_2912 [Leptospira interrogans serovar Australis str. 200703203]EKN88999.1 hypothetical protein LEP1GSC027_4218 [Leptospira interrogans str. 2002000624]EKQ36287.1 hypothetical protein LEP1GSC025_0749 [Leptospira interrogans str. 2002000621]EKQ47596.1 hypothetical protein LEP1GSC026_4657 [Leptospira interrogans str. 2002
MDAFEPIEIAEEKWIKHCEDSLNRGKTPPRWEVIPGWIKTDRMRKYYVELKKRIMK